MVHRMSSQIFTRKDTVRHTAGRVAVAVSLTVVLTLALSLWQFGMDPDANVRAGTVVKAVVCIGIAVAALLTGGLSYRSAEMMRQLSLARVELQYLAQTDKLTGLLNRRGFDEAAMVALSRARREKANVAALMCDIDRFKQINDRFGHEFGDQVLIEIGEVLRALAHKTDILVGRHGGEEFAALVVGISNEQAAEYAERLRGSCALEISHGGVKANITVSVGFVSSTTETKLSNLMRIADQALYAAKHRGRNRVARASDLIAA